jgi:hypothetical protein
VAVEQAIQTVEDESKQPASSRSFEPSRKAIPTTKKLTRIRYQKGSFSSGVGSRGGNRKLALIINVPG